MSILLSLSETDLEKIIPLLAKYESQVVAAEPIFNLQGRKLEEIARTLPYYQVSYDKTYNDVKGLEDWLLNIKEKIVGKAWRKYNEGYSKTLSARDITAYIGADREVVEINQILIEVVVLKNNLSSIVDAIKQMSFMVGHVTKLRVAELQETIL
jgi:hypothetical protein